jgi:membrane protease YdiL (CAAX protease family)
MMDEAMISQGTAGHPKETLSAFEAWRNALAVTLLGCLLLGLGDFVFLADYLPKFLDLYTAAIWLQIGFTISAAIIFGLIVVWQRNYGSSLGALGWGRPTTGTAIMYGIILAVAWLGLSYMAARKWIPQVDVTEFTWARLALVPSSIFMAIAEETIMRGFFITQLDRAGVPTWVQIITSGACTALYHGLQNFTLMGLLPSMVFFAALAGIYVLGKRSLTPSTIAHGLINVVGEPYLLMMLMVVNKR